MSLDKSAAEKPQEYRLETQAWFKTNPAAPKTTVFVNEVWHRGTFS